MTSSPTTISDTIGVGVSGRKSLGPVADGREDWHAALAAVQSKRDPATKQPAPVQASPHANRTSEGRTVEEKGGADNFGDMARASSRLITSLSEKNEAVSTAAKISVVANLRVSHKGSAPASPSKPAETTRQTSRTPIARPEMIAADKKADSLGSLSPKSHETLSGQQEGSGTKQSVDLRCQESRVDEAPAHPYSNKVRRSAVSTAHHGHNKPMRSGPNAHQLLLTAASATTAKEPARHSPRATESLTATNQSLTSSKGEVKPGRAHGHLDTEQTARHKVHAELASAVVPTSNGAVLHAPTPLFRTKPQIVPVSAVGSQATPVAPLAPHGVMSVGAQVEADATGQNAAAIAHEARRIVASGGGSARVAIHPASLGPVTIQVSMTAAGSAHILIQAATLAGHLAINASLPGMSQQLAHSGVVVASLRTDGGLTSGQHGGGGGEHGQQRGQTPQGDRRAMDHGTPDPGVVAYA